jgi:hypothetical protein
MVGLGVKTRTCAEAQVAAAKSAAKEELGMSRTC